MSQILIDMLRKCRDKFAFYGQSHRAKGTEDADKKADVNAAMASDIDKALAEHSGEDLSALERLADYRFGTLVKGKRYAFARGLTINPTHLPAALDAMESDGFTLVAIFGQTDAQNIGFIFKRTDPEFNGLEFAHGVGIYAENERLRKRVDELLGANNVEVERRREAERKWKQYEQGVPLGEIK
jgi:hypothetical protein